MWRCGISNCTQLPTSWFGIIRQWYCTTRYLCIRVTAAHRIRIVVMLLFPQHVSHHFFSKVSLLFALSRVCIPRQQGDLAVMWVLLLYFDKFYFSISIAHPYTDVKFVTPRVRMISKLRRWNCRSLSSYAPATTAHQNCEDNSLD